VGQITLVNARRFCSTGQGLQGGAMNMIDKRFLPVGLAIGIAAGVATGNLAIGIALGLALGLAVGRWKAKSGQ
jgi:hypothetical protein